MKCPSCNVNLVMSERSGIEIDYCQDCRGVWLDRGELDKIIERSSSQNIQNTRPESNRDQQNYSKGNTYHHKKKNFLDDLFDF